MTSDTRIIAPMSPQRETFLMFWLFVLRACLHPDYWFTWFHWEPVALEVPWYFCRAFLVWRCLGFVVVFSFFVQSEELHELWLLVFTFALNLQIHFQQHMLAIHWQGTSDLLEVTFRERVNLNDFYNTDMLLLYPINIPNYHTFVGCQWILTELLWFLLFHVKYSQ